MLRTRSVRAHILPQRVGRDIGQHSGFAHRLKSILRRGQIFTIVETGAQF
jgi:hypothetical protein